jgi:hypothetical protein
MAIPPHLLSKERVIVEMTATDGYVITRCSDGTLWRNRIGYGDVWIKMPPIPTVDK